MSPRLSRISQTALSLLIGLTIWEVAGWQFNASVLTPVLGSTFAPTAWLAGYVADGWYAMMSVFGVMRPESEPHPGALPRLFHFLNQGDLTLSLLSSLQLFITGFSIALAIGLPLGLLMARVRLMRVALESYILALYVTPMAALIPFILAIFGYQFWPKVIVVTLFSVFPILYNTLEGARSLKPEIVEVARSFRSSEVRLWIDALLPYTLPYALTGVRQAVGRALVGMVAAEIFLSNTGLGGWLVESSRSFDMAAMLGDIVIITLLGVTLMAIVRRLEARFAAWRGLER
jgi:ABC-type nitrate/sulfonate/bicarbonate transport system permease component